MNSLLKKNNLTEITVKDQKGQTSIERVSSANIPEVGQTIEIEFDPSPWGDSHQDDWEKKEVTVITVTSS